MMRPAPSPQPGNPHRAGTLAQAAPPETDGILDDVAAILGLSAADRATVADRYRTDWHDLFGGPRA